MFSGLIQAQGRIQHINQQAQHLQLQIQVLQPEILAEYQVGDSLAVDGACLTAITVSPSQVTMDIMTSTARKTTLAQMSLGTVVNLERALKVTDRFEGHLVAGHIDDTVRLLHRQQQGAMQTLFFNYPEQLAGEIVQQGSVALNGVSLTVDQVQPGRFSVGLIPHSIGQTTFSQLPVGALVNIETDLVGKYVKAQLMQKVGTF